MSLEEILQPEIKINVFNKDYKVSFTLRNFAAIKRIFKMSEQDLVNGLINGDIEATIAALWGSTLEFQEFSPESPIAIKNQLDIEKLYSIQLADLQVISGKLCDAIIASMPKPEKKKTAKKKSIRVGIGRFFTILRSTFSE